ncbi:type II toxin-antitoxin system RelE/ParE family toxin [Pseudomonas sp. MN1F]|uniref:type II toxin-antitoxin system RelE/ParE family toxin n=1 Tax=Pseudomonas sp. MN1F TaxID=1366632 RepID=UPI00128EB198|nr:type II toxin-antitoxin system RelE/ParE family toxin [Pseudomonas sp. MN1F]MQG92622.1 type II toxin-antitoxin system RelE/ParE family toxin [Pseudomonas sp. MN1F]
MFRMSPQACIDIADTLRFTEVRLGQCVRNRYQDLLQETFIALAEQPTPVGSKMRDELSPGLRSLHLSFNVLEMTDGRMISPRHIVFYRAGMEQTVEILRVLHDAMEVAQHLIHLDQ